MGIMTAVVVNSILKAELSMNSTKCQNNVVNTLSTCISCIIYITRDIPKATNHENRKFDRKQNMDS